jgi:thioredoxin 2
VPRFGKFFWEMSDGNVVACPRCGQKNRIRAVATGAPHCAKCGSPLPWLTEISTGDFVAAVERSPIPVLADFWAPWCAPCRVVAPVVERLSADLAGKLKVVKINTDEQPLLQSRFGVQGIPTLILFADGQEKDRVVGAMPGPALRSWIESRLQQPSSRN